MATVWKRLSFKPLKAASLSNSAGQNGQSNRIMAEETPGPDTEAMGIAESVPTDDSTLPQNNTSAPIADGEPTNVLPTRDDTRPRSSNGIEASLEVPIPSSSSSQPRHGLYRRISFRSLAFFYGRDKVIIPTSMSAVSLNSPSFKGKDHGPKTKQKLSRSEKEARAVAINVRAMILGPSAEVAGPDSSSRGRSKSTKAPPVPSLEKVKAQLAKPKSANLIISQLRTLPVPNGPSFHATRSSSTESIVTHPDMNGAPIHAVCLPCTDEEADKLYFSKLKTGHNISPYEHLRPVPSHNASKPATMGTASLESFLSVVRELRPVSLLQSPDLGFGQAVSEQETGPLAGSVPSAATVLQGFEDITKQLMTLGFATSQAVFPDHAGIYPPEDRLSVLTYWWGMELVMPEPTVQYFGKVKSVSGTVLNLLSALSVVNEGVREILPFIRYISNFVDYEWNIIKAQDQGKGVVCAATWIMPAALVPRPWDFLPKPAGTAPSTVANATEPTKLTMPPQEPVGNPRQDIPIGLEPPMPQLMVTSPTLPRGFNAQEVIYQYDPHEYS